LDPIVQANIDLGAGLASWDGAELGRTKGETKITYSIETYKVETEEDGTVDEIIIDDALLVTIPLVYTDVDTLFKVIPWSHVVVDGADKKLVIGKAIGTRLYQYAKQLVIHPIAQGDADISKDVTIFKCFPKPGPLDLTYAKSGERIANIQFVAVRDSTKAVGYDYFGIGDQSIAVETVAPTVSSTVPVDDADPVAKALGLNVDFQMSEDINPATVVMGATAFINMATGVAFTNYTVSLNTSSKIRLTTAGALAALTQYAVILNTGIADLNGNHLAGPYVLTFTTGA
jgi:hypothetical protein